MMRIWNRIEITDSRENASRNKSLDVTNAGATLARTKFSSQGLG